MDQLHRPTAHTRTWAAGGVVCACGVCAGVASAWAVVALYVLAACGVFLSCQGRTRPASPLDTLRAELDKDAQMVKEMV